MKQLRWGTPEDLQDLLCELVSWSSISETNGEIDFPVKLQQKLQELDYLRECPSHLQLHNVNFGRKLLTALYKASNTNKTIVLMSHFDTVNTEEYGDLEPYAFKPLELTRLFHERIKELPEEAVKDLQSGEYLFGRGTMDMKMGLVMHLSLLEKAIVEQWPINILLVTVPDEEVNSAGMRAAVSTLAQLKTEHNLDITLFLNGEPVFAQEPGDTNFNVYTGSIGKLMPSALFYGKETHVGEPLGGMTATFIASFLTQKMEWNSAFQETVRGETTPLPVTLQQKDLKMEYSVQTPYRAVALYNVFVMKRNAEEIMNIFEKVANEAADECNLVYQRVCKEQSIDPIGNVKVVRFHELLDYAIQKLGFETVQSIKAAVNEQVELDDRERSFRIADTLFIQCQELGPAIVLLYTPPYYPAVNSSDDELIGACLEYIRKQGTTLTHSPVKQIHYFNGISDLSYVKYTDSNQGWTTFVQNNPVWGESYTIPFEAMKELQAPVLNIGPFGKDAHRRTERLHKTSAFEEVPALVEGLIKTIIVE